MPQVCLYNHMHFLTNHDKSEICWLDCTFDLSNIVIVFGLSLFLSNFVPIKLINSPDNNNMRLNKILAHMNILNFIFGLSKTFLLGMILHVF